MIVCPRSSLVKHAFSHGLSSAREGKYIHSNDKFPIDRLARARYLRIAPARNLSQPSPPPPPPLRQASEQDFCVVRRWILSRRGWILSRFFSPWESHRSSCVPQKPRDRCASYTSKIRRVTKSPPPWECVIRLREIFSRRRCCARERRVVIIICIRVFIHFFGGYKNSNRRNDSPKTQKKKKNTIHSGLCDSSLCVSLSLCYWRATSRKVPPFRGGPPYLAFVAKMYPPRAGLVVAVYIRDTIYGERLLLDMY